MRHEKGVTEAESSKPHWVRQDSEAMGEWTAMVIHLTRQTEGRRHHRTLRPVTTPYPA